MGSEMCIRDRGIVPPAYMGREGVAKPFGQSPPLGLPRYTGKHGELLPAQSTDEILICTATTRDRGERPKHRVARKMPVGVVDRFEVIDIDRQKQPSRAFRALPRHRTPPIGSAAPLQRIRAGGTMPRSGRR